MHFAVHWPIACELMIYMQYTQRGSYTETFRVAMSLSVTMAQLAYPISVYRISKPTLKERPI